MDAIVIGFWTRIATRGLPPIAFGLTRSAEAEVRLFKAAHRISQSLPADLWRTHVRPYDAHARADAISRALTETRARVAAKRHRR